MQDKRKLNPEHIKLFGCIYSLLSLNSARLSEALFSIHFNSSFGSFAVADWFTSYRRSLGHATQLLGKSNLIDLPFWPVRTRLPARV